MVIDEFKLNALSKKEGLLGKYNVIISADEGDGIGYHVLSIEHKGVPLYFDFETVEKHGFKFDYVFKLAKEEISNFEQVSLDPKPSEQKSYIMSNFTNIFAYQCENHGLRFHSDVIEQITKYINKLIDKNNEDFIKTYKELVDFVMQDSKCFESDFCLQW